LDPPRRALPSFPTRRSSDLAGGKAGVACALRATPALPPVATQGSLKHAESSALQQPAMPARQFLQRLIAALRQISNHAVDGARQDRKSTRLNSSHVKISYAV